MAKIPLAHLISAARPAATTAAETAAHAAAYTLRHPFGAVRQATGLAVDTIAAVAGMVARPPHEAEQGATAWHEDEQAARGGRTGMGTAPTPAPPSWEETEAHAIRAEEPLKDQGDALTTRVTEPSEPPARGDQDELRAEADTSPEADAGDDTEGATGRQEPAEDEDHLTQPLLDEATAKQVRAETDVLRKASDTDKS